MIIEKSDQPIKGKILIKDLKNSIVYNETVKEVENKKKEKAARMEDGEISDSNSENRTPTLSPTPPRRDSFDPADPTDDSSIAISSHQVKDLRLVLKHKEKVKKTHDRRGSREEREPRSRNDETKDRGKSHRERSRDKGNTSHSKDRKSESMYSHSRRRSRSRGREYHRTRSNERRFRDRSNDRRSTRSRERRYSNGRSRSEDKGRDRSSRGRSRSKERK